MDGKHAIRENVMSTESAVGGGPSNGTPSSFGEGLEPEALYNAFASMTWMHVIDSSKEFKIGGKGWSLMIGYYEFMDVALNGNADLEYAYRKRKREMFYFQQTDMFYHSDAFSNIQVVNDPSF